MTKHNAIVQKLFADKRGKSVIVQKPNLPIMLWAVCVVANKFISAPRPTAVLHEIGTTALVVWAFLEIGWGANYFRRILGVVVLAWTIFGVFG